MSASRVSRQPVGSPIVLAWPGKGDADGAKRGASKKPLRPLSRKRGSGESRLYHCDNLRAVDHLRGSGTRFRLIYLDPPFLTQRDFALLGPSGKKAFGDRWDSAGEYLSFLRERLDAAHGLLLPGGSLVLHCDWRASHWLRCLLDEQFGVEGFRNEIVWRYRRWPSKQQAFQRMHDVLLWYVKAPLGEAVFHQQFEPLAASTLKAFGTSKQQADFSSGRRKPSKLSVSTPGAPLSDVWEIGVIAPIGKERLGYPTQKPLALLERLVLSLTSPGDWVADLFCGSGTTLAAAASSGRRWVGCDQGLPAIRMTERRLASLSSFEVWS